FWKVASGEPSSYTVTIGSGIGAATLSLMALINAQMAFGNTLNHQSGSSATPASLNLTPPVDDCIMLSMVTVNNSGSVTMSGTWSAPMIAQEDFNAGGIHTSYQ